MGLSKRGEQHGQARITATQATRVHEMLAAGFSHGEVTRATGINTDHVRQIHKGTCWAWLPSAALLDYVCGPKGSKEG